MKSKEEIEYLAANLANPNVCKTTNWIEGYTQCQEDIVKGIRFLIYRYKSDILLLEEEFREGSSVLIVEKIVTLQDVINNLETKFYIKD